MSPIGVAGTSPAMTPSSYGHDGSDYCFQTFFAASSMPTAVVTRSFTLQR